MNPSACFSQSYAEARGKFLAACLSAGLVVESYRHPLPGRDGEPLALDVARNGPLDASKVLIISSGCHGVEGFCGSAVQIALLSDPDWLEACAEANCAVLYLHAANPYGFSWWRRWTHENVDLNRNFRDFSQPRQRNQAYATLDPILIPRRWPSFGSQLRLLHYALRHGRKQLQAAIASGQDSHPNGLFYMGSQPTWSNQTVRQVLRKHARDCARIGWIDLHTGLGPKGHGERIYVGDYAAQSMARTRRWWGPEVTSSRDGESVSVPLTGQMILAAASECPQAELTAITLEYGTLPGLKVLKALRAEQWLNNNPGVPQEKALRIHRQLRDAFYVDEDGWKHQVLEQAAEAARQGLAGLCEANSRLACASR
ncbi:M14 family metallopeptidase [Pseudomonas sp. NY15181]|uniref:M14 family metallopeptidase n=1 Tax=Pseudomonas sp. NY15181 TaxID=3400349 RepID=UPI003A86300A